MDKEEISQACLDKGNAVTTPSRRPELWLTFRHNGLGVSDAGDEVTEVPPDLEDALTRLLSELKSEFPTVAISLKRVLSNEGVSI